MAIRGDVAISVNQRQSGVISGNQGQSGVIEEGLHHLEAMPH